MEKILVTRSSMPPFEEYMEKVRPLWDSHWLTNMGANHNELEKQLKEFLKVDGISLMVNGHMALELIIHSFHFPKDSEVITTPFTFVSTTHAIVRNGLKPVFCDIKMEDGTIDETKIEGLITDRTVAIVPVHVYGNMCNVNAIEDIAKKHNLKVIYDAAHAFGINYKGKGIGSYGDASIFSFHATKVFNTIEGGAVTYNDPTLYEKLFYLRDFGIKDEESVVDIAPNAKMNEFAAAMGLCNLKHLDDALASRKKAYELYVETITATKGLRFLGAANSDNLNYSYMPVIVEDEYPLNRDELKNKFAESDVYVRKYFYPLTSNMECFNGEYKASSLDNAEYLSRRVLTLPLYEGMSDEGLERIMNILKNG